MKPTLEESIEQLKTTTEPPERLKSRLEELATTSPQRCSRGRDWLAVGAVGTAIAGLSIAAARLNITPPPEPLVTSARNSGNSTLEEAYQQIVIAGKKSPYIAINTEISRRLPAPDSKGSRWRRVTGAEEVKARKEILNAYKSPLRLVHKAMKESTGPVDIDKYIVNDYSGKNDFDHYYMVANLLGIEVLAKVDNGDIDGAWNEALDMVALGNQLEQGMQWRGWQAANVVKVMGWQALKRLIPHLSATEAQKAARRLEQLEAKRAPLAPMFQATRWAAYKTFQTKSWDQCMFDFVISYGPRSTLALKATPKAWIIAEHLRYLEALENYAKDPGRFEKPLPPAPKDAFNQYMESHLTQVFTDDGLSRISAALMIGLLRRKADPQAPLPEDPFAPGKALRERSDGLIYSVGLDRVDNGGKPVKRIYDSGDIDITRLL